MNNLSLRLITGVIFGSIILFTIFTGGMLFDSLFLVMGAVVLYEFLSIVKQKNNHISVAVSIVSYLAIASMVLWGDWFYTSIGIFLICLIIILVNILQNSKSWWDVLAVSYSLAPVLALITIRASDAGCNNVLFIVLVVWATDVGGYVFGKVIGGKKLCPKISPNKTYSGALGSLFFSFIVATILVTIHIVPFIYVFVSIILSIISQIGDLFESSIKRRFGVKDSGNILPGHGGVMDRVDGLIFAAIAFYFLHFII